MPSVIKIEAGRPAWLPSPADTDLEVLHHFDGPLVATFLESDSRPVVAMCLGGEGLKLALWAYAALTDAEWAMLEGDDDLPFETPEELHNWVADMLADDRYCGASLAIDGRVVFHSDVAPDQDFYQVAKQLVQAFDPALAVRIMRAIGSRTPAPERGEPRLEPQLEQESQQLLAAV